MKEIKIYRKALEIASSILSKQLIGYEVEDLLEKAKVQLQKFTLSEKDVLRDMINGLELARYPLSDSSNPYTHISFYENPVPHIRFYREGRYGEEVYDSIVCEPTFAEKLIEGEKYSINDIYNNKQKLKEIEIEL